MQSSSDQPNRGDQSRRRRQLGRWGPIVALVAVVAIIAGIVVASTTGSSKSPTVAASSGTGAISFSQAKARGLKVTFPAGCDQSTGRVAIPYFYAPECYANVANNGGATSPGVTGNSVKVVLYQAQPNDPILSFINGAIHNADTNEQAAATNVGYSKMFESLYQTYGRHVDIQVFHASGISTDEVAARADAARVAAMHPFAVWGGPALTTAWADELAADHVICLACTGGSLAQWYAQRAPYVWTVISNGEQSVQQVAEYVGKKLAGQKAIHAGDPALTAQPRKFGLLYINSDADSKTLADELASTLKTQYGVNLAAVVAYTLDPASLQEQSSSAIAKLKAAGVTSVIFNGDPVAPGTFTRQATTQQYFPEWVIGATVLVDTTVFARTYDQRQWAHAFGVSFIGARVAPDKAASYYLYQWFNGQAPPAFTTSGVILPQPAIFYAALQAAGANLNPQTFQAGMFSIAPRLGSVANPTFSYGSHGLWPYPTYNGIDDATEVWWDPVATGPDEVQKQGMGMYRYVDGGKRYLAGHWPRGNDKAFDPAGTVILYEQVPPSDAVKNYSPPTNH